MLQYFMLLAHKLCKYFSLFFLLFVGAIFINKFASFGGALWRKLALEKQLSDGLCAVVDVCITAGMREE